MSLEMVLEIQDILMRPPAYWADDFPTGAPNDVYYTTFVPLDQHIRGNYHTYSRGSTRSSTLYRLMILAIYCRSYLL